MKSILSVIILLLGYQAAAKMVFQKQTDDLRLIVLAENDGTQQKVISNPNVDTYHPEISSSGRYVAYSRGTIQPGKEVSVELVIKDLQEGITEVWTPKGNQYIHAEFSGNDRYLVFSGFNKMNSNQNIMVVDLQKERKKGPVLKKTISGVVTHMYSPHYEIIESAFDSYAPAVSSDGSFVIYHRTLKKNDKTAPKQLILYDRGEKKEKEITDMGKHAMFPSLSANDRYIAYTSKDSGQWDIYLYDLWNGSKRQLTDDKNIEFTPVFSSEGDLFYTRFETDSFNNALIDIYFLGKDQVLDSGVKALPQVFLNDKDSAEYVPSFSNPENLEITQATDLLSPARSSFGAISHQGKIYVAGGHQGPEHTYPKESFLDALEVYDESLKTWKSLAPMSVAKHGFQMTAHGNYLYVFGGFTYSEDHLPKWKSVDTVERYDIKNNTWTTLAGKLPNKRSSNALAKVGDKVYLLGGWDSTPKFKNDKEGRFLRDIDIFDLNTESSYKSTLKLPDPLRRALTAVTIKNDIFLLGGIGEGASHFEWVDNFTKLNTETNTWKELPPLPFATFAPGAGEIEGDIFLIGGMILRDINTFDLDYVDDIYRFDHMSKTWSHTGVYLEQNKGFPQVVTTSEGGLGVLGGHTYEKSLNGYIDHPVKSFEILNR